MLRISVLANLTALIGLAIASQPSHAVVILGSYTFDGDSLAPSGVASNISFSNFSANGVTNLTFPQGNPNTGKAYSASGWDSTFNANKYFSFTVTPTPTNTFDLTTLTFDARRSGTGPQNIEVRSSLDNYVTQIATLTRPTADTFDPSPLNVNLSGFNNISSELSFRIYGYNASAAGGTLRVDNVQLSGDPVGVPFESNAFPVLVSMVFFGGGMIVKRKLAKKVVILDENG